MRFHRDHRTNGTITIRVVCAVVFMLFSFLWLYAFQADVLAVLQHHLSQGQTTYNRLWGAIIITVVLQLLQLFVAAVRLHRKFFALTYVPSMLILALISAGDLKLWLSLPLLVIWGLLFSQAHRQASFEDKKMATGLFSRCMWVNLLQMALLMLGVAWIGNTHAVYHYRTHAEVALKQGFINEALRVGQRSIETDPSLTMLRIYALAKQGELGNRLFEYPISGTSADMIPVTADSHSSLLLLSADSIWQTLHGSPAEGLTSMRFFQLLERRDSLPRAIVGDYRLCGYLIDRHLEDFVALLPSYYDIKEVESLPRYYREALFLHDVTKHRQPADTLMQRHWADYLEQSAQMTGVQQFSEFGKSYWYYYQHQSR